jgi:hypothetical protein
VTSTGFLLIPLGGVLAFMPWPVMLAGLVSFALLHGSAVYNHGSVGLQPGYFLGLLVIARVAVESLLARQGLSRPVLNRLLALAPFVLISILILLVALALFQGEVQVLRGTDNFDLARARPYTFRRENLTQLAYLAINATLAYAIAHQVSRWHPRTVLEVFDRAVIVALLLALLLCVWQMGFFYLGVPFVGDFLFSNAGYESAEGEASVAGYLRLSGPFSEPAALAYYFAGFLLYAWQRLRLRPTARSAALVAAALAALALSFSTTAVAVLALFALVVLVDLLRPTLRWLGRVRVTTGGIAVAAALLLAASVAIPWILWHWQGLHEVFRLIVLDKPESGSYEARSGADLMALEVFLQTFGLGLGLGSHKANSLALTLLANVGVLGTLLFVIFIVDLLFLRRPRRPPLLEAGDLSEAPLRWFILGLLFAHVVSNPNLSFIILWIGFGFMAGYLASWRASTSSRLPDVLDSVIEGRRRSKWVAPATAGGRALAIGGPPARTRPGSGAARRAPAPRADADAG